MPRSPLLVALISLCGSSAALAAPAADFDRASPLAVDWLGALRRAEAPARPAAAAVPREGRLVVGSRESAVVAWEDFSSRLAGADVVYVGEQHDQASHHLLQLEVLKELLGRGLKPTVGLEMVDRTKQGVLDDFSAGRLSEAEFAAFWEKAWGFPFALYRPVLAFARDNGVPLKALNAPTSVVRSIAKLGLANLSPAERALLPERVEQTANPRYLAYVKETLNGHGELDPAREARMLEAMAAWNETMGAGVVEALAQGRGPVLVVAGMGHTFFRAGIGESAARRAAVRQVFVLPYPLDGSSRPVGELLGELLSASSQDRELGDYFRLIP